MKQTSKLLKKEMKYCTDEGVNSDKLERSYIQQKITFNIYN